MPEHFEPNKLATTGRVSQRDVSGLTIERPSNLLELAKAHAITAGAFEDVEPFFVPVTISSDQPDSHFTYMDAETTLQNFALEAGVGVAVLDSHDSRRQPFGRSITGENLEHEGKQVVSSWYYIVPGINTSSGMTTDDYIRLISTGVAKDISIGAYRTEDSWVECNICKQNMLSWDCEHWPGFRYTHPVDLNDPEGEQQESLALGRMIDWHLAEYSQVYKGSNHDSETLHLPEAKARMFGTAGELTKDRAFLLERAYDIDLGASRMAARKVIDLGIRKEEPVVQTSTEIAVTLEWSDELRSAFAPLFEDGVPDSPVEAFENISERIRTLATEQVELLEQTNRLISERDEAVSEVDRLKPLAADGEAYRKFLIDDAIQYGIRAMGAKGEEAFPKDAIRTMLEGSTITSIEAYRDLQIGMSEQMAPPAGRTVREASAVTYTDRKPEASQPGDTNVVALPATAHNSGTNRRRKR